MYIAAVALCVDTIVAMLCVCLHGLLVTCVTASVSPGAYILCVSDPMLAEGG